MKKKGLVIGGIAAVAVLTGGWALAQPAGFGPGGMGPGGMHGQMGPGMHGPMTMGMHGQMGPGMHGPMGSGAMQSGPGFAVLDPARLDALKTELGIKPAQEQAWTKYTKAVQDSAAAMKTAREGVNPEAVGKLGPQERFAIGTKMREQAQKQHDTVKTAANDLLTTLDDAQKTKAQQTLPGLVFGPGPMRGAFMGGAPFHH